MSVWARFEGTPTRTEQPQLARDVVDALRDTPPEKRVRLARALGLPENAREKLGDDAGLLLGYFVDDDALRDGLGWRTIATWLLLDRSACLARALAHAAAWPPGALWLLLDANVDPSEVFDVLAPLFRANGNARQLCTRAGLGWSDASGRMTAIPTERGRAVLADARFVDLALETMSSDPVATCCLLGVHGSRRAVEELRSMLDQARSPADAVPILAGLELALEASAFVDVLAAFLAARGEVFLAGVARGRDAFAELLARMSFSLSRTDVMRADPALSAAVHSFVPPMPVG